MTDLILFELSHLLLESLLDLLVSLDLISQLEHLLLLIKELLVLRFKVCLDLLEALLQLFDLLLGDSGCGVFVLGGRCHDLDSRFELGEALLQHCVQGGECFSRLRVVCREPSGEASRHEGLALSD